MHRMHQWQDQGRTDRSKLKLWHSPAPRAKSVGHQALRKQRRMLALQTRPSSLEEPSRWRHRLPPSMYPRLCKVLRVVVGWGQVMLQLGARPGRKCSSVPLKIHLIGKLSGRLVSSCLEMSVGGRAPTITKRTEQLLLRASSSSLAWPSIMSAAWMARPRSEMPQRIGTSKKPTWPTSPSRMTSIRGSSSMI